MRFKNILLKHLISSFSILATMLFLTPSVSFASEIKNGPAQDTTDVKIIDSMPIVYSDSTLNASLAVLDMSSGKARDLHKQTVPSGTVLTYVITYRNDNSGTETVHLQIPVPNEYPLRSIGTGGDYKGTIVSWDNVTVKSGDTVSRYITCDTPHPTSMIPNTGLVSMPDKSLATNTVEVAVASPAAATNIQAKPADSAGVLGAVRKALKTTKDSPAVLGMRRAIQTGDISYIVQKIIFLALFCLSVAALIIIVFKDKGNDDQHE